MKGLFPTRWRYDRPPSIQKFMADFSDDYACAEYLYKKRWPEGFQCPRCTHQKGWRLESRPWLWECSACGRQTSLIAGTVMHDLSDLLPLPLLTRQSYALISVCRMSRAGGYQTNGHIRG